MTSQLDYATAFAGGYMKGRIRTYFPPKHFNTLHALRELCGLFIPKRRINQGRKALIALVLLIIGCTPSIVCRHEVFPVGLVYAEKGYDIRVVEYRVVSYVSYGISHAQVQVFSDHKWKWAMRVGNGIILRNSPEYPVMEIMRIYSLKEYFDLIYSGQRK